MKEMEMKMTLTCRHVVCRSLHSPLTPPPTQRERHIHALTLFEFDLLIETKKYQNKKNKKLHLFRFTKVVWNMDMKSNQME